jgi:hypothetical protein
MAGVLRVGGVFALEPGGPEKRKSSARSKPATTAGSGGPSTPDGNKVEPWQPAGGVAP